MSPATVKVGGLWEIRIRYPHFPYPAPMSRYDLFFSAIVAMMCGSSRCELLIVVLLWGCYYSVWLGRYN